MLGRKLIPWLLAACFLAVVMRGADHGPAAPDGGQHATNGALIHDYLHSGRTGSPMAFAQDYLVHYPAVSIGYHPPVFHAVEAFFFTVFGVSPQSARLTVAVFAALSVVLLYRLIRQTHGSDWFACVCVLVFFSLQMSQQAASDVMLEFPSLMFVLLALHCLKDFQHGFSWPAALSYAVVSSAAIWTKQHNVFLGLIPFLMVMTTGRWREIMRPPLWTGAILFGAACLLLAAFMGQLVGDAYKPGSQVADTGWARYVVIRNLVYYPWRLSLFFAWPTLVATLVACVAYLVLRIRDSEKVQQLAIYAAWAAAVIPVPLVAWQRDERYLFAGFPAFIVILLDMVRRATQLRLSEHASSWATVLAAVLMFGLQIRDDVTRASGPVEAAEYVWQQQPKRVLVCGRGEYQFIFTMRCLADDQPEMVILRGSKVPRDALTSKGFEKFAHDYAIQYVVIGDDWPARSRPRPKDGRQVTAPWLEILHHPTEHMKLEKKLEMVNTFDFMRGDMLVYRFTNPSPDPMSQIELQMNIMNRSISVDLDEPQ
jgi:4-amino-4-deoxy-L-arabinose transferase-like glycosyltransferase